jgi:hypothetical protein
MLIAHALLLMFDLGCSEADGPRRAQRQDHLCVVDFRLHVFYWLVIVFASEACPSRWESFSCALKIGHLTSNCQVLLIPFTPNFSCMESMFTFSSHQQCIPQDMKWKIGRNHHWPNTSKRQMKVSLQSKRRLGYSKVGLAGIECKQWYEPGV